MKNIFSIPRLFVLLSLSITLFSSCYSSRRSVAVEEGWELLGENKVNFVRDKDELIVTSRSLFTEIRFRVEDREVRINDLKIYFQNGDKLEPAIDFVVPPNQDSRIIELARDGRNISKIEFSYRTTGNVLRGRANVIIYGKRYVAGY
ncbi:MAG TPA: hypothetical protein VM843_00670 [Flavisolibacter sp.]|jgi:hypothetical protein|nr:hypothetical protein [Flavisolibacter sp.]